VPAPPDATKDRSVSRLWLPDADEAIRQLYRDVVSNAEVLAPDDLLLRLDSGERPAALIVDGRTLEGLPPDGRAIIFGTPRLAVCSGAVGDLQVILHAAIDVRILQKPFSIDEFEAIVDWLTEVAATA
jgi:hypothetical protein